MLADVIEVANQIEAAAVKLKREHLRHSRQDMVDYACFKALLQDRVRWVRAGIYRAGFCTGHIQCQETHLLIFVHMYERGPNKGYCTFDCHILEEYLEQIDSCGPIGEKPSDAAERNSRTITRLIKKVSKELGINVFATGAACNHQGA